jgi:hypothetical protein
MKEFGQAVSEGGHRVKVDRYVVKRYTTNSRVPVAHPRKERNMPDARSLNTEVLQAINSRLGPEWVFIMTGPPDNDKGKWRFCFGRVVQEDVAAEEKRESVLQGSLGRFILDLTEEEQNFLDSLMENVARKYGLSQTTRTLPRVSENFTTEYTYQEVVA